MAVKPKTLITKVKKAGDSWTYSSFFDSEWISPHSPFRISAGLYLLYRLIIWLFVIINFFLHLSLGGAFSSPQALIITFSYLTVQSITLVTVYFTLEFCLAILYFVNQKKIRENFYLSNDDGKESKIPLWVRAKTALGNITIVSAFTVTLLYWTLLHKYEKEAAYFNIFVHGLNSVVCFIDLFVVERCFTLYHVYQPFLFGIWYISFSVVYFFAGGVNVDGQPYVYPIMDWRKPGIAVLTSLGALLVVVLNHFFVYALFRTRRFLRRCILGTSKSKEKDEVQSYNVYTIKYHGDNFAFTHEKAMSIEL